MEKEYASRLLDTQVAFDSSFEFLFSNLQGECKVVERTRKGRETSLNVTPKCVTDLAIVSFRA